MTAPTYEIKTVADFLRVPLDSLGACLQEFHLALMLLHLEHGDEQATDSVQGFVWTDDGQMRITDEATGMTLNVSKTTEAP